MLDLPRIALLIETSNGYGRGLLAGVHAWMRENNAWSVYLAEQGRGDRPPPWLKTWKGDGVIARIENEEIAAAIRAMDVPVVDMSAGRLIPALPWCEIDEDGIAKLAAEHFLARGFRHFAYCGDPRFVWSKLRSDAFDAAMQRVGYTVHHYVPSSRALEDEDLAMDCIGEWLQGLPQPTAVFTCYDIRGRQVLDACRRFSIPVPDQVAVLGVDNDELLCSLSFPPLSSIIPNALRTGYEAAAILHRLMQGEEASSEGHLIPPTGVITRQSTDMLAVEDPHVAKAVRFIRERACTGICVDDVVKETGLSRRLLENRFRKALSRSPHEEMTRVQLLRVKELLAHTEMQLSEIADRTGFRYVEYLSAVFKQKVGIPPGRYRTERRPKRRTKD